MFYTFQISLFSFLVGVFAASCRKPDSTGDVGGADAQSLINSGAAWPDGRVEVCYVNEPEQPIAKEIVKTAVTANYSAAKTGIEFFGFKQCTPGSKAQARLLFGVQRAYSRYIGTRGGIGPQGETIAMPVYDRASESYFYNVAIHEFGHFAGLFHEQQRMENQGGELCSRARDEIIFMNEFAKVHPGIRAYGAFDRMSVMNYCVQGYNTQLLKLSDGDVKALRELYAGPYKKSLNSAPAAVQVNPAELCNIVKIGKVNLGVLFASTTATHVPDGTAVYAYLDESFREEKLAGTIPVDTTVSRLITKPIYKEVHGETGENLTAMQVIPHSGSLKDKKVWIYGNITVLAGCREK